ncbi:MAG: ThuA domain-containing protein [Prevotellaceae bacterium]|jgi:type 1 glutamine amidotransferase|nr:ThuA domain-containing protein [Prevotellaceae bacterium]
MDLFFCVSLWKRAATRLFHIAMILTCLSVCTVFDACRSTNEKAHVLIVTGGHDYDREEFKRLLDALPVTYEHVEHPHAHAMLKAGVIAKYDVVLLYDMPPEIPEEAQSDFVAMLEQGKGLVVLHHALGSYPRWPEYTNIAGGKYHFSQWVKDSTVCPPSEYAHDMTFQIRVADKNHPVTKGVSDFQIIDETYNRIETLPSVHPLLVTDEPSSCPLIAWTNSYRKARVVTILSGHDEKAWQNPSFQKILTQAILWTAKR